MTNPTLPVVGAAMPSLRVHEFRDWILEGQRDLEIQDPALPNLFDGDWRGMVQALRPLLDGYTGRLGVHGPFYGMPLFAPDRKVRAAVAERLNEALDYCAELGATHMVLHSPIENLGTPFKTWGQGDWFDSLEVIHNLMDPIVAHAASIGCMLVIETIFDRDPLVWKETIAEFDSPYLRASVDIGHVYINHKLGAPPPDYWIRHAGPLLGHVHLQDTDGYDDRHWRLGVGDINLHAVFDALARIDAQPRLILEMNHIPDILPSTAWLVEQGLAR